MSKILDVVKSMGCGNMVDRKPKVIDSLYSIKCECGQVNLVTVGAIYKQNKRGHDHYKCKHCAGQEGWTSTKRKVASDCSKKKWADPNYSGTIDGKAIANAIKRLVGSEFGG